MANNETIGSKQDKNKEGQQMIDTDNDGKLRQKGDTSDHGDPKSPFGKGNKSQNRDESDDDQ